MQTCPKCGSDRTVKNGSTASGKAKRQCNECKAQYTVDPEQRRISEQEWELVRKLRLEGLSLRGVHRVTGISLSWLVEMNKRWSQEVSEDIQTPEPDEKKTNLVDTPVR